MRKTITTLLVMAIVMLSALPVQAQTFTKKQTAQKTKVMRAYLEKKASETKLQKNAVSLSKAEIAAKTKFEARAKAAQEVKIPMKAAEELRTFRPYAFGSMKAPLKRIQGENGETTDNHGIIIAPAEGTRQVYSRSGMMLINDAGVEVVEQSGNLQVVTCNDGTVYIRNILASEPTGAWVKGQKEGNIITVATRQPIYYNSLADVTYSIGWGIYEEWMDSYSWYEDATTIDFEIDEEEKTISLQGSSRNMFIGLFWDDDNSFAWRCDWESVWTYANDFEPLPVVTVTAPENLTTEEWYVYGHKTVQEQRQLVKGKVTVGFSGNDVYLKGVFAQYPDAWMKGTIADGTASFEGLQVLGEGIYAAGVDAGDLTAFAMTYDAEGKVLRSANTLMATTSTTETIAEDAYNDIAIQADDPFAPIETLPYTNALGSEYELEWFTIIDANDDGKTWHLYDNKASYEYHSDNNADDWLISPAFRLEAGKTYYLSFDANCSSEYYTERLEVKMGQAATAEAMTTDIMEATDVQSVFPVSLSEKLISISETGVYYFGIHAISEADRAALRVSNFELGKTVLTAPAAVSDLTVTSSTEGIAALISFTAPEKTIGGEDLTANMDIDLLRDGEVIKTFSDVAPGSAVNYTDDDEELTPGTYKYQVITSNADGRGDKSPIVEVVLKAIFDIPFTADFSEDDTFSQFTTIDANEDGSRWEDNGNCAAYEYNSDNAADDWLITPGLRMEAGKRYNIVVTAEAYNYPERFEVLVGKEATVEGMTVKVIENAELTGDEPSAVEFEGVFTCEETGIFYAGVHCISDADQYELKVYKIVVETAPELTAPAAPELTVTAGAQGARLASIAITAPSKNIEGNELTENLTKIDVLRDGEIIKTEENVVPGKVISLTDEDEELTSGTHSYQAIPYNADGVGMKSEKVTVFIGTDVPVNVTNVKAVAQESNVLLTWDKVASTGRNGGYVNTAEVTYKIYACEPNTTYVIDDEPVATVKDGNSCVIDYNPNEGEQGMQVWVVTASTDDGDSYMEDSSLASLTVGKPYDLPVVESFADGSLHYYCDYVGVPLIYSQSSDGDGAALALASQQEDSNVAFLTGKLNIKDAKNPTLLVDVATFGADEFRIIASADGQQATELLADANLSSNYKAIAVPLNSLKDANSIMLGFTAHIPTATVFDDWTGEIQEQGDALVLDNIRIIDQYQHNLSISLEGTETVQTGGKASYMATVTNWGEQTAKDFIVTIKAGETVLKQSTVTTALAPFKSITLTAEMVTTLFTETGEQTVIATVDYTADELADDNTFEMVTTITDPIVPTPGSLAATDKGEAGVDLSWIAPTETIEYTESFEDGMGGWTMIDADGDGYNWSYSKYGETEMYMSTNSGLASVYSESYSNKAGKALNPDNWLVSPRATLNGEFTFYAKGQDEEWCDEHFAVYVSTTSATDANSFTPVSDELVATSSMDSYAIDLSSYAGQKGYVAIRHFNVTDQFALVIDDITYTMDCQPVSYNIYYEGEKVAATEGSNTAFTVAADKLEAGERTFAVTAVYNNGQESKPVTAKITVTSDIRQFTTDGRLVDVYSLDGKLLLKQAQSLKGLKGAFIVGGKTVIVK